MWFTILFGSETFFTSDGCFFIPNEWSVFVQTGSFHIRPVRADKTAKNRLGCERTASTWHQSPHHPMHRRILMSDMLLQFLVRGWSKRNVWIHRTKRPFWTYLRGWTSWVKTQRYCCPRFSGTTGLISGQYRLCHLFGKREPVKAVWVVNLAIL